MSLWLRPAAAMVCLLFGCGSELEGRAPSSLETDDGQGEVEPEVEDSAAETDDTADAADADTAPETDGAEDSADSADSAPDASGEVAEVVDAGPPAPCDGLAEGAACDDGDACTLGDRCLAGACLPLEPLRCDDDNACTDDTCDAERGCVHLPNLAACDDGDPCSSGDRCSATRCRPGAPTCDDGNACTRDACAPDGTCSNVADNDLECEDGSACTAGDFCAGGFCIGGGGDGCAESDPCVAVACGEDGLSCEVQLLEGTGCDDGDACTVGDRCGSGICRSGGSLECPWDTECAAFRCDKVEGCLLDTTYQAGKACSDDDRCTLSEKCDGAGVCAAEEEAPCDDDNPCTDDSCDASWGCQHSWVTGPCDDASACTSDDKCEFGQCRGTLVSCDDLDACTIDSCDPLLGCQRLPLSCDDDNVCTSDSCERSSGCRHNPKSGSCDDGLACTLLDSCVAGVCTAGATTCDDDDPCTIDRCDGEEGCVSSPLLPCPLGELRIAAVGANASESGRGQWVAIANDGAASFDLGGYAIRAEGCDCEALFESVTIDDATLYGLHASAPAPTPSEIAPGGPASADDFDFEFGQAGDGFHIDARGDRVELLAPGGEVVDSFVVAP